MARSCNRAARSWRRSWRPRATTGCAPTWACLRRKTARARARGTAMTMSSAIETGSVEAVTTPGLHREAVVALSESKGEPQWLRESRLEGWAAFEDLPLPRWTKGIAQWWTTDVSELNLSEIKPFVRASKTPEEARAM